jgi:hypothetical protein
VPSTTRTKALSVSIVMIMGRTVPEGGVFVSILAATTPEASDGNQAEPRGNRGRRWGKPGPSAVSPQQQCGCLRGPSHGGYDASENATE